MLGGYIRLGYYAARLEYDKRVLKENKRTGIRFKGEREE